MTKRERVLAAMNQQPVDHVPASFWFHFGDDAQYGEANLEAHLKYYRNVDLDFVKIMSDGYFPYPIDEEIKTPEDFYKIKALDKDHPYITDQLYRASRIVEEIGKDKVVFYNVFAPFSSIRFALGDDLVMDALKKNPQAVMTALDTIADTQGLLCELLVTEAGCDGIYFPVQGGEFSRFTTEEYHTLITPSEVKVLNYANKFSDNNIMHCCGWAGEKNNIAVWKDYPVKCVNWAVHVEGVSLEEGRELFGGKTCLGGFKTLWDGQHREGIIYHGSKEELQEYTREMIRSFGKKGLMLGGDCTVDSAIGWERFGWILEAARSI